MTKKIDTLVEDIYARVLTPQGVDTKNLTVAAANMGKLIGKQLMREDDRERPEKTLFASEIGEVCNRKIWFKLHRPDLVETLLPHARIKFMYGDMLEQLVLLLAREAGHEVTEEQKGYEVEIDRGWKIRGRQDATIDGIKIDVKSASEYSFKKFQAGLTPSQDAFGYLPQLGFYNHDTRKERAGFLAIDKTLGTLALDMHEGPSLEAHYHVAVGNKDLKALERPGMPPDRGYEPVKDAKLGVTKLGPNCAYCGFKSACWGSEIEMKVKSGKPIFVVKGK